MIVIKVELWPHGFETNKRLLGQAIIANDGTGTKERGNYKAKFILGEKILKVGKVRDFPRLRNNVWDLIKRALSEKGENV